MITVYTKPDCQACVATKRHLSLSGVEYAEVDITQDPEARDFVAHTLGYTAAPVVYEAPDVHWAGFRPDRLVGLTMRKGVRNVVDNDVIGP